MSKACPNGVPIEPGGLACPVNLWMHRAMSRSTELRRAARFGAELRSAVLGCPGFCGPYPGSLRNFPRDTRCAPVAGPSRARAARGVSGRPPETLPILPDHHRCGRAQVGPQNPVHLRIRAVKIAKERLCTGRTSRSAGEVTAFVLPVGTRSHAFVTRQRCCSEVSGLMHRMPGVDSRFGAVTLGGSGLCDHAEYTGAFEWS